MWTSGHYSKIFKYIADLGHRQSRPNELTRVSAGQEIEDGPWMGHSFYVSLGEAASFIVMQQKWSEGTTHMY